MDFFSNKGLYDSVVSKISAEKKKKEEEERIKRKFWEGVAKQYQDDIDKLYEETEEDKYVKSLTENPENGYTTIQKQAFEIAKKDGGMEAIEEYRKAIEADNEVLQRITNRRDLKEIEEKREEYKRWANEGGQLLNTPGTEQVPKWMRKTVSGIKQAGLFVRELFNMREDAPINNPDIRDLAEHKYWSKIKSKYEDAPMRAAKEKIEALVDETNQLIKERQQKEREEEENHGFWATVGYTLQGLEQPGGRAAINLGESFASGSGLTPETLTQRNNTKSLDYINLYFNNDPDKTYLWSGYETRLDAILTLGNSDIFQNLYNIHLENKSRDGVPFTKEEENYIKSTTLLDDVSAVTRERLDRSFFVGEGLGTTTELMLELGLTGNILNQPLKYGAKKLTIKELQERGLSGYTRHALEALAERSTKVQKAVNVIDDIAKNGNWLERHAVNFVRDMDYTLSAATLTPMTYSSAGERYIGKWYDVEQKGLDGKREHTLLLSEKDYGRYVESTRDTINILNSRLYTAGEALMQFETQELLQQNQDLSIENPNTYAMDAVQRYMIGMGFIETDENGKPKKPVTKEVVLDFIKYLSEMVAERKGNLDAIGNPSDPEHPLHDIGYGQSLAYGYWKSVNEIFSEVVFGNAMEGLIKHIGGKVLGGALRNLNTRSWKSLSAGEKIMYPINKTVYGLQTLSETTPFLYRQFQSPWVETLEEYEANLIPNIFGTKQEYKDGLLQLKDSDFFYTTFLTTLFAGPFGAVIQTAKNWASEGINPIQSYMGYRNSVHYENAFTRMKEYGKAIQEGKMSINDFNTAIAGMLRPRNRGALSFQAIKSSLEAIRDESAKDVINELATITYLANQSGNLDDITKGLENVLAKEAQESGIDDYKKLDSYKVYQHILNLANEMRKFNDKEFVSESHKELARKYLTNSYLYKVLGENLTNEADRLIETSLVNEEDRTPENITRIRQEFLNLDLNNENVDKKFEEIFHNNNMSKENVQELVSFVKDGKFRQERVEENTREYDFLMDEKNIDTIRNKVKATQSRLVKDALVYSNIDLTDKFFAKLNKKHGIELTSDEVSEIRRLQKLTPMTTKLQRYNVMKKMNLSNNQITEMADRIEHGKKVGDKRAFLFKTKDSEEKERFYSIDKNNEIIEVSKRGFRKNRNKFQVYNISPSQSKKNIFKDISQYLEGKGLIENKNTQMQDNEILGRPVSQDFKANIKSAMQNKPWQSLVSNILRDMYPKIYQNTGYTLKQLGDALKEIGNELQEEGFLTDFDEKLIDDSIRWELEETESYLEELVLSTPSESKPIKYIIKEDDKQKSTTTVQEEKNANKNSGNTEVKKAKVELTINFATSTFTIENGTYKNTDELTDNGKKVLNWNLFKPGSKITLKISDRWKDKDYEIHYTTKNGVKNSSFTDFLKYLGYKGKATSLEDIYNELGEEKFRQVLNVLPIDVSDENGNTIENGIQNVHDINEVTIADFHDQALNSDIANLDVINKKKIDDAYKEYLKSSIDDKEDKKKKFEELYKEVAGKDINEVWKKAQDIQKQVIDGNQYFVSELRRQIWNAENKTIEAKIEKKEAGAAHFKPSEKQRSVSEVIPTAKIGYIADKTGKISIGSNKFLKRKGGIKSVHYPKAEPGITVVYYEDPLSEDGYGFLLPSTNTEYLIDKGIICASSLINKFGGERIDLYSEEDVRKIVKEFYPNIELSKQQLDNIYQMLRNNHNLSHYPYYGSEKGKWKWSATTDLSNISSVYRISETGSVEELNKDDYENLLLKSLGTRETFKNVGTEENPMWTNHAHPNITISFDGIEMLKKEDKKITQSKPLTEAIIKSDTKQIDNTKTENRNTDNDTKIVQNNTESTKKVNDMNQRQESFRDRLRKKAATTENIFHRTFSKIDITTSDVIKLKDVYKKAEESYDELLNELKKDYDNNKNLILFLENRENRDEILGIGSYKGSVREKINNFLLVNTKEMDRVYGEEDEDITDFSANNNELWDKESFEKDVRLSMSTKCRIFFVGIKKVNPIYNIDGLQEYESPDAMYYAMKEAFYESKTNSLDDVIAYMDGKIKNTQASIQFRNTEKRQQFDSNFSFYDDIKNKLIELRDSKNDQVLHEITYVLNTNKVLMDFIMLDKGSVKDYQSNSRDAYNKKRTEVTMLWSESPLIEIDEQTGKYYINRDAVSKLDISGLLNRLEDEIEHRISKKTFEQIKDVLSGFGFQISDQTLAHIFSSIEPITDGTFSFGLSDLFDILISLDNRLKNYFKQNEEKQQFSIDSINDVFLNQGKPNDKRLFRNLVLCENYHTFSPTEPMYVAGKIVNSFEQNRAYHIILKQFKNDILNGNIDKYQKTNYIKKLFSSGLISAITEGGNINLMEITQSSLQALKYKNAKNKDHMSFPELEEADRLVTLLGYLTQPRESINQSIGGCALKVVKMAFPPISDAKIRPLLTTLGFNLIDAIQDTGQGGKMDDVFNTLFDFVVGSELERVISYYINIANTGSNIGVSNMDIGSRIIVNNPFLNTIKVNYNGTDMCMINAIQLIAKSSKSITDVENELNKSGLLSIMKKSYKNYINNEILQYYNGKEKTGKFFDFGLVKTSTNKAGNVIFKTENIDKFYIKNVAKRERIKDISSNDIDLALRCLAAEYVINTHFTQAQISMLFSTDPANYVDKGSIEDVENIDVNNIQSFYNKVTTPAKENALKRLKALVSPGNNLSNSQDRTTVQVMLSDNKTQSFSIRERLQLYYDDDVIQKFDDEIYIIEHKQDFSNEDIKTAITTLKNQFPKVEKYLNITSTDAQEYVTWKNYLNQLKYQGRISKKQYDKLYEKLQDQSDNGVNKNNKLTDAENKIIFQPSKPLYSGIKYEDVNGYKFQRFVYIKTASFPLLPELTQEFEIDDVRKNIEKFEAEEGYDVRISYNSGNKVGATKDVISLDDISGDYDIVKSKIKGSSVLLDNKFFSIQQDKPYKMDKHIKDGVRDEINMMTQFEKIIFSNGINKIKEKIFDAYAFKDFIKESGLNIKIEDGKVSGEDLYKIYTELYKESQELFSEQLKEELGISNDLLNINSPESFYRISRLLQLKLTNQQDLDGIQVLYTFEDVNGQIKKADRETIVELGVQDRVTNWEFTFPIWMLPNSRKFESLLNSIINNNSVRLKLPGSSGIVASQQGFKMKSVESQDNYKGSMIFTREFATREKNRGVLVHDIKNNVSEVFMSCKFRTINGKVIDIRKYIDEDGYIDDERFPEEIRTMFSARIPTSSHQSGMMIKVVGFLPENTGDLMIVSQDATVQLGEDYDIDTRYYYMYNIIEKKVKQDNGKYKGFIERVSPRENTSIKPNINKYVKSIEKANEVKERILSDSEFTESQIDLFNSYEFMDLLSAFIEKDNDVAYSKLQEIVYNKMLIDSIGKNGDAITNPDRLNPNNQDVIDTTDKLMILRAKYYLYVNDDLKEDIVEAVNYKKEQENKKYLLENNIIDIYKTIFTSKDNQIKQLTTKSLNTDSAEKSSRLIEKLIPQKEYSFYSPLYQDEMLSKGSDGKVGVSFYSAYLTANGLIQQASSKEKPFQFFNINKKGKQIIVPMTFGTMTSDMILGKTVTNSGRNLTDVFMELQNVAVDNQKLQIMGRVNMNRHTIGVYTMMALLGLDKETGLSGELNDYDYPQLFMSQPIIRDYVEMMSAENAYTNRKKAFSREERRSAVVNKLRKKYKVDEKIYNEKGYIDEDLFSQLTTQNLINQFSNVDNVIQHLVLSNFIRLQGLQEDFSKLQKFLNIESSGLGISFFDTIDRKDFLLNTLPKLRIKNVSNLIGDYFYNDLGLSDTAIKQIEQQNGVRYIGENSMGRIFIKPKTFNGYKIVNSVMNGYNLWKQIFPFDEKIVKDNISEIFSIYDMDEDDIYASDLKYDILSSMKDYLYAGLSSIINAPNYTRQELFIDSQNNESLAKYILKMKKGRNIVAQTSFFALLNPLLGTSDKESSILQFNVNSDYNFDRSMIHSVLLDILDSEDIIEDENGEAILRNGREYTYKELAEDLFKYSLLAGNQEDGIGFRNYIPIEYFKKFGTIENIKNSCNLSSPANSDIFKGSINKLLSKGLYYDTEKNLLLSNTGKITDDVFDIVEEINDELGFEAFPINLPNNTITVNMNNMIEDNLFIVQYIQHNPEDLPELSKKVFNPIDNDGALLTSVPVTSNDVFLPKYIKYEYQDKDDSDNNRTVIFVLDENNEIPVYNYLESLGDFGMNEYNPYQMQNESILYRGSMSEKSDVVFFNTKPQDLVIERGDLNFYQEIKGNIVNNGMSLPEVFNEIAKTDSKYYGIASLLYSSGIDVNVEFKDFDFNEDKQPLTGEFDPATNTIIIYDNMIGSSDEFIETILHEAIHAVTTSEIDKYYDINLIEKNGTFAVQEVLKEEGMEPPIAVKRMIRLYKEILNEIQNENESDSNEDKEFKKRVVDGLAEFMSNGNITEESYSFRNVHEMLTELLFNNADLRRILDKTTYKESGVSMWSKFKDFIVGIFKSLFPNAEKNSMTQAGFDIFKELLDNYKNKEIGGEIRYGELPETYDRIKRDYEIYSEDNLTNILQKYC